MRKKEFLKKQAIIPNNIVRLEDYGDLVPNTVLNFFDNMPSELIVKTMGDGKITKVFRTLSRKNPAGTESQHFHICKKEYSLLTFPYTEGLGNADYFANNKDELIILGKSLDYKDYDEQLKEVGL